MTVTWRRIGRDGLSLVGVIGAVAYWTHLTATGGLPVDARAYWTADPAALYPGEAGLGTNAYLYTPAFEFVVGWWRTIPFEVFVAIWRAILLATLVWLAGPFTILVLFTVPVASEINAGNIQILLAASIVLGFRYPATWAFVLLTKVTPGIGLLWFALRRQWRPLGIVLAVTCGIALISFAISPGRWFSYAELATSGAAPSVAPYYLPLWVRLPFALGFAAWGAWTARRWPIVVAGTLALPVFYTISPSMLVGVLPFAREALGRRLDQRGASPRGLVPTAPTGQ